MQLNRRTMMALAAGMALPSLATPLVAHAAGTRDYRGWTIDDSVVPGGASEDLIASTKAQIDLVESVKIKPEIIAWWRTMPLVLDPALVGHPAQALEGRVRLSLKPQPRINPVVLHEMLHEYHREKIPSGYRNPTILAFLDEAKAGGWYPANSYMFQNVGEYFAMNGSVVLWGRAALPPSDRATVLKNQPDFYAWVVKEFGLAL